MPRPRSAQPAYQYHVSGQAKVRLADVDFYLGKHGTPESYARYYALLAEYNANGKAAPERKVEADTHQADAPILVSHITADFRERALPKQERNPQHHAAFKFLLDLLERKHGKEPIADFGPRKLEGLRDWMLARGNCRKYANEQIGKIIAIVKHGVSRELVKPDRIVALTTLPPLKPGEAKDNPKRKPVALDAVRASLPHLTPTARAMVTIQLATAMRPSELFRMRLCDIDRSGPTWFYRPPVHKSSNKGKDKAIPIIGEALTALAPYLFGEPDSLCFITSKGTPWNKNSYRIAVARAAKAAKVAHWTPYQVRHATLQAVRDAMGAEAVQALAGHSRIQMAEVYSQAGEARAAEAARHAPTL